MVDAVVPGVISCAAPVLAPRALKSSVKSRPLLPRALPSARAALDDDDDDDCDGDDDGASVVGEVAEGIVEEEEAAEEEVEDECGVEMPASEVAAALLSLASAWLCRMARSNSSWPPGITVSAHEDHDPCLF